MTVPKKAMLLAAGLGLRMREVTRDLPKPLVRVCGKTLLDHNLDLLARSGVAEAVVNVSHLGHLIEAHLETRRHPAIVFSREETPLETGGGIARALPLLGAEPFFVLNGDTILLDGYIPALHRLAARFDEAQADGVLLLHPAHKAVGYSGRGDFLLDSLGRLRRRTQTEIAPFVFAGVQILHPRLFENAPQEAFSMNLLYDRTRDRQGRLTRFRGLAHDGAWLHVGDKNGLTQAERFLIEV